ncbi:oxidoreductase NAD-binding domain-containing protein 1-like [Alternaria alternata]|nr:oxidoreductase NAD-binding domain-containing protein 1-like [Alternaria alternata]
MARLIFFISRQGGGQTKLPPTRTVTSFPRMSSTGCHNHAAGGLSGLFCTASSKYGTKSGSDRGRASEGDEVMVNPPAFSTSGTKTSSHWPGRN